MAGFTARGSDLVSKWGVLTHVFEFADAATVLDDSVVGSLGYTYGGACVSGTEADQTLARERWRHEDLRWEMDRQQYKNPWSDLAPDFCNW